MTGIYRLYSGVIFKNIFELDSLNSLTPREVSITGGGAIPRVDRFYFDLKASLLVYSIENIEVGFGSYLSLNKLFLKNPSLVITASGDFRYDNNKNIDIDIESSLGINIKKFKLDFDFYIGDRYNYKTSNIEIYSSFVFKPKINPKIDELECYIKIIVPDTTKNSSFDNVIISINGNFSNDKTALKRWSLFIYEKDLNRDSVIKTFSGENIPPSSIIWDFRNSGGDIVKKGRYYAKIVLIDKLNRSFQSKKIDLEFDY